jgi:hypothetical protein
MGRIWPVRQAAGERPLFAHLRRPLSEQVAVQLAAVNRSFDWQGENAGSVLEDDTELERLFVDPDRSRIRQSL